MTRKILDVPFVSQKPMLCGPAALSMMLQYSGKNASQEDLALLVKEMYNYEVDDPTRDDPGMDYWQLATLIPQYKLIGETHYNLSLEDIPQFIDQNKPLIARITGEVGKWAHFLVIKGYDSATATLFVNDSLRPEATEYNYTEFETIWDVGWHKYPTANYGITIRKKS